MKASIIALLLAAIPTVPSFAAQTASLTNACGVPVHHALVEIGRHTPPQIFTPEPNNGRMEFNYLREATEPLTAMCFRTAEESSLFRVPLPQSLTRCAFTDGALACSGIPVPASAASSAPSGMPPAVTKAFLAWQAQCEAPGEAVFSEDYLTVVDIDGDGNQDYVLNGDGATCVDHGKVVARGGGNGGTSLTIFTRQGQAVSKALEVFTQGAEIRSHKGYATLTMVEGTTYGLANGKATKSKPDNGGTVVYTLGR
ncbi:hypothetical protein [Agrobacterium larrymoorei]|uniref:FG-GAP repeat protein n=1 Tax=Agrobacterium larrymoorei TaxID=160699 RepID=A0AAF0H8A7_9HYPH|nr:hypothetical protein [Agrobacterium larrymoorei]WHA39729.1 hypothetical protein CFBP5477_007640 [Agrobacterium larrymoorei]